jgi:uncharacterized protein YkwD
LTLPRASRSPLRRRPHVEELERRLVPSGLAPTAEDQLLLEEINAARANPAAYGATIGVSLSNVAPAAPLAWNPAVASVAQAHSQDMSTNNYFSHVNPQGQDLGARLTAAGFAWTSYSESIAAGYATAPAALAGLIADVGVPDLGHRLQLLAIGPAYQPLDQVGIGIVTGGTGQYVNYYTIDTVSTANTNPWLTGTVYNDLNGNGVYDIGEGLGGVTVQIQGGPSFTTYASGGYQVQLAPGTYTVTFSGGGLPSPITEKVTLGSSNYWLDVTPKTLSNTSTSGQGSQTGQGTSPPPQPNYTAWVTQLGQDLLGQPLAASTVSAWVSYLQQGGTTAGVIAGIYDSAQAQQAALTEWVSSTGQSLLGRPLTSTEVSTWTTYLQSGGSAPGFVVALVNSNGGSGLTPAAWVNQLNQGLLGGALSSTQVNAWVSYLQSGGSETVAAASFLGSSQYVQLARTNWLNLMSNAIMGRSLTSTEMTAWLGYLQGGGSPLVALESFVNVASFTQLDLYT